MCCLHIKEFGAVPPLNLNPAFLSHRRRATRLPSAQDSPFSLFTCMHKLIRALFAWLLLLCLVFISPRCSTRSAANTDTFRKCKQVMLTESGGIWRSRTAYANISLLRHSLPIIKHLDHSHHCIYPHTTQAYSGIFERHTHPSALAITSQLHPIQTTARHPP